MASADGYYYLYSPQNRIYQRQTYDHAAKAWVFLDWMPYGWAPPPPQPPAQTDLNTTRPNRSDSAVTSHDNASAPYTPQHGSSWSTPYLNTNPYQGQGYSQAGPSSLSPPQMAPAWRPKTYVPRRRGGIVTGTSPDQHERVDVSYRLQQKSFFTEGRVLAIIMNETAGENAKDGITDYNSSRSSIHRVKYEDNYVYTNARRFVVVRQKREFCYACPIFTYSNKATTKTGVRESEHGIAYSYPNQPEKIPGEGDAMKPPLCVYMSQNVPALHVASRIYYGIVHPIQYNVKVKDIGFLTKEHIPYLISGWKSEEENGSGSNANYTEELMEEEEERAEDTIATTD